MTKPFCLGAVAATGHGIPEELLSEVFRQFQAAFALPQGVPIEGDAWGNYNALALHTRMPALQGSKSGALGTKLMVVQ